MPKQPKDYGRRPSNRPCQEDDETRRTVEAYPHPTIADQYAVRKVGRKNRSNLPARKQKPTMARRAAAAAQAIAAKLETCRQARKVADSARAGRTTVKPARAEATRRRFARVRTPSLKMVILTSGSFPSPKYMEASGDTKLSKWRDESKRLGADLYIGRYSGKQNGSHKESLIFGMTWESWRDRQQKKPVANSDNSGRMPKDAVLCSMAKQKQPRQRSRRNQPSRSGAKPEAVTLSSHDANESARAGTLPTDDPESRLRCDEKKTSGDHGQAPSTTKDALRQRMGGCRQHARLTKSQRR